MDLLQSYLESDSDDDKLKPDSYGNDKESYKHDYFSILDDPKIDSGNTTSDDITTKTVQLGNKKIELPQGVFWNETEISLQRESVSKILDPVSHNHESAKILDPVSHNYKSAKILDPVSHNNKSAKILDPVSHNYKSANILDSARHNHKSAKSFTNTEHAREISSQPSSGSQQQTGCTSSTSLESSPFYNTMRDTKDSYNFKSIPEIKLPKNANQAEKNFNSSKNREQIRNENRNIFFIHGRIGPFLGNKCVKNKCPSEVEKQWNGHNQVINRINWNRENYSHLVLTTSMDTSIKVWNVWSSLDLCVKTLNTHDKAVRDALWDLGGDKILSCGYDRSCCLTCVKTGTVITRLSHESYVFCCKYHPSNPNIVITGSSEIVVWDLRTPTSPISQFHYKDKLGQIQDILFDYDGETIFSCSDIVTQNSSDRNIMAWDYKTSVVLSNQIYEERYTCNRLKLHPQDSGVFLAQSQGGYIAIFSTKRPYKMNKSKRFEGHQLQGRQIGFDVSLDGEYVVSGSCDRKLYCYNYRSGKLLKTLSTDLDFTDVAFHPVLANTVIASSWDGQLQLLH